MSGLPNVVVLPLPLELLGSHGEGDIEVLRLKFFELGVHVDINGITGTRPLLFLLLLRLHCHLLLYLDVLQLVQLPLLVLGAVYHLQ